MKNALTTVMLLLGTVFAFAQYPNITIRQMQEMPLDSLLLADTLQNIGARWRLQTSPYLGDTVTITAVCVVPSYARSGVNPEGAITFTQRGWTMLLADTGANPYPWGGVLVRVGSTGGIPDTNQAENDGFLAVERGDVIRMTGRVDEFPTNNMNSVTQFVPIPGRPIPIIGSAPVPQFVNKTIPEFYSGLYPGGRVRYSTGEPYEGCLVNLELPLTVNERVDATRGTFSVVDGEGNQLSDYDASRYFTLKGSSIDHPRPDSIWQSGPDSLRYPVVGARVERLRGFMTTVSGSQSDRGYRVAPLYRRPVGPASDALFGPTLPSITTHRRNPIVVPSDSAARISCRVTRLLGGFPITSVELFYSLSNGPFTTVSMNFQSGDTTYVAQIPSQPENTFVHYFIKATDSLGQSAILANSSFGGASSDTSKGFFFYTVLNRPLTIHDIQYTPYTNGRSAYIGATVSARGVITADSAHLRFFSLSNSGTTVYYLQDGTQPWNGLWFVAAIPESLAFMQNGDSVTVTGTVAEQFDVTRLQGVTSVVVHTSGRPEPAPVVRTTGTFRTDVGNGTPSAEQWEGMLVRFNNVVVTAVYPEFNDRREFEVDDGTGPVRVLRDGKHTVSNDTLDEGLGYTIIRVGDRISHLIGLIYFSFNRYKHVPRTNADFGTITSVETYYDPIIPRHYALSQNYPNPFNPSTTIEYHLPIPSHVVLKIYNILGQEVRTLVREHQRAGKYTLQFDATAFPSGVYFYRLQAADYMQVKKMLLLK
jgi:hypothetical protein